MFLFSPVSAVTSSLKVKAFQFTVTELTHIGRGLWILQDLEVTPPFRQQDSTLFLPRGIKIPWIPKSTSYVLAKGPQGYRADVVSHFYLSWESPAFTGFVSLLMESRLEEKQEN